MSTERVERRLAAILAVDVAGYSRLMGADEEGTLATLKAIRRELVDSKIDEHRGRIVKTVGDGLLVEFPSVVDAVRCAVEMQREMIARNGAISTERRIDFRMGINVDDIIIEDGDIFGDGVNIAARLKHWPSQAVFAYLAEFTMMLQGDWIFFLRTLGCERSKTLLEMFAYTESSWKQKNKREGQQTEPR